MTLIEVLVALAIASVVFASVFLIYRTAAATALRQHENEKTTFAPAAAFAALQQDVASLLPDGLDTNISLKLETKTASAAGPLSEISFAAWRAETAAKDGMWADAEKVLWRVENPGAREARLVRISSVLTGPRSSVTETNGFLTGIANFHLQFHDGSDWTDAWPPPQTDDKKKNGPKSLRVEIALNEGGGVTNWSTDFLVPISLFTTSRVERASKNGSQSR